MRTQRIKFTGDAETDAEGLISGLNEASMRKWRMSDRDYADYLDALIERLSDQQECSAEEAMGDED